MVDQGDHNRPRKLTRREMLTRFKHGFGSIAFMGLASNLVSCNFNDTSKFGKIPEPHYRPKAKSIIFLYMDGGVSQVDSFDPKPRLTKENGEDPYKKFKVDATQFDNIGKLLRSPWKFKQYGESGMPFSELFPYIGSCADDIAMVRSMEAEFPEHTNANYFLHTGHGLQGRPSMGAWVTYGLGTESENLPGYVVIDGGLIPPGGLDNFNSGFLPASYQASLFKTGDEPVPNINPNEESFAQENKLKFMNEMDNSLLGKMGKSDQVESAIKNYELAYKMQSSVPELTNISGETNATKKLYGIFSDDKHTRNYGTQCLLARRLVERGVRFIELTCPDVTGNRWDQHSNLINGHGANAHAVDQPIAGLIQDLKTRGLLEDTLLVFAGEFGRTPFAQGNDGRDHNPQAFSIWLAGAGVKGGTIYGSTDEYGYRAEENPTSIHDLHATMLHLAGVDHERLTYHFGGRDIRLTDVHGHIIKDILV